MDIILTKDVETLGEQGAVVQVAEGYARNYLFPRKLAVVASTGALKDLASRRTQLERKAEKRHQENLAKAAQLTEMGVLLLEAHVGDGGKLFGTITPKELAGVLEHKVGFPIDRKDLLLSSPINRVGHYELTVRLSSKVKAAVPVQVLAEGEYEAQQQAYAQQEEEAQANGYYGDDTFLMEDHAS